MKKVLAVLVLALTLAGCGGRPSAADQTLQAENQRLSAENQRLAAENQQLQREVDTLKKQAGALPPPTTEQAVRQQATLALQAMQNGDMTALSGLVHPTLGVRFSPNGHLATNGIGDPVFTAAQLPAAYSGQTTYLFGHTDGKGDPINLTLAQFLQTYVLTPNYAQAPQDAYNQRIGASNTLFNLTAVYPGAVFVEYHYPGTSQNNGFDWKSLRLAFVQHNGTWYLVAVSHDRWTI